MRKMVISAMLLTMISALALFACTHGSEESADLDPNLFQDTIRILPNPAVLYEKTKFYFAFEDHNGDLDHAVAVLRLQKDEDDPDTSEFIEAGTLHVEGKTSGAMWFELEVLDGYEGHYFVSVIDDAGNISNEIEVDLFVDPPSSDDDTV